MTRISTMYPNMSTEEIVEFFAGAAGPEIIEEQNVKRRADYSAWQIEPVSEHMGAPLPGGPLVVGEWYDVSPGGGRVRSRMWRQCQYVGRVRDRDSWGGGFRQSYAFMRYGAKAGTDPYMSARRDTVGVNAVGFEVTKIEPDPKVLAKIAQRAAELAARP